LAGKAATHLSHDRVELRFAECVRERADELRGKRCVRAREHVVDARRELIEGSGLGFAVPDTGASDEAVALERREMAAHSVVREAELACDLCCGGRRPTDEIDDSTTRPLHTA
jgi:hypothetical protein